MVHADPNQRTRLRALLAAEVHRIVEDLTARRTFLLAHWDRYRDRTPFVDVLFARWRTLSFGELTQFDQAEIEALDAWYRELDRLRTYLRYTEDMPVTLSAKLERGARTLHRHAEGLLQVLEGPELTPFDGINPFDVNDAPPQPQPAQSDAEAASDNDQEPSSGR